MNAFLAFPKDSKAADYTKIPRLFGSFLLGRSVNDNFDKFQESSPKRPGTRGRAFFLRFAQS